jgi:hypothetical protein
MLMDSKLVKDLENDLSQLNRLGVAYFLLAYFRFLPRYYFGFSSAHSRQRLSFSPPNFWRMRETRLAPAQFLADG